MLWREVYARLRDVSLLEGLHGPERAGTAMGTALCKEMGRRSDPHRALLRGAARASSPVEVPYIVYICPYIRVRRRSRLLSEFGQMGRCAGVAGLVDSLSCWLASGGALL